MKTINAVSYGSFERQKPGMECLHVALEPLLPSRRPPPGLYMAVGEANLPSWFLCALAPALGTGLNVFWIDAGNSFNAYGLSYAARAVGFDPKTVLSRVSLARPFNLFQLNTLLREKLSFIERDEAVVLSDPLGPLFDEDLSFEDASKGFAELLDSLGKLPAIWLALVVARKAPPGREGWLEILLRRSQAHAFLMMEGGRWQLEKKA